MCVCKRGHYPKDTHAEDDKKIHIKVSHNSITVFYGELCVYGEPQQLIPYTIVESELRCPWPDGTDSMHSARCEGFGFRTKDAVKAKDGTWVNAAQNISGYYMFGFHLNFDSETFYCCQILHDCHMPLLDPL